MELNSKNLLKNSFWQILLFFCLILFLINFGYLSKYALHFEILSLIIALIGFYIFYNAEDKDVKVLHKYLVYIIIFSSFVLITFFRLVPYMENDIPIGYDTGIYRYAINHGLQNMDYWVRGGVEPGFLYLMSFFKIFFNVDFILKYVLIFFSIVLGFAIYFITKKYFSINAAVCALLIYSLSVIQYKVFSYMYYKNLIALYYAFSTVFS